MSGMGRGRGRGAKPKEDTEKAPPRGGPPPAAAPGLFKARTAETTSYSKDEMKDLFQPTPCPSNVPNAECISENAVKPRFVLKSEKESKQPSADKWATPPCLTNPTKAAVQDHDLFWDVPDEEPPKEEAPQKSKIELELEETKRQMEEYKQMMEQLARGKEQMEEERRKMEAERKEIERLKAEAAREYQRTEEERLSLEATKRQQEEEKRQLLEKAKQAEELRLAEERKREEEEAARLQAEQEEQEAARIEQERLDEERREQEKLEAERLEQEQAKNQKVEKERKRNEEREKRRREKEEREQRQREAAEERKREEEEEARRKLEMKKKREEERQKEKQRLEEEAKKKAEQRAAAGQSKPKPVWDSSSDDDKMDFASLHAGMKSGQIKGKKGTVQPPKQSAASKEASQPRPAAKVLALKPKGTTSAWGSVAAVKKPLNMKKILAEELKKGTKNSEVETYLNPEKSKKKKQKYRQKVNHGSDDDESPPVEKKEEEFVVPLGPQVDQELLEWSTKQLQKLAGPKSTLDVKALCEVLCMAGTAEELRTCAADGLGLMKGSSRFVEELVEKRWPTGAKVQQLKQAVQQKQQPQPKKSQGKGRKAKTNLNNLINFGVVAAPSFNAGEIETV